MRVLVRPRNLEGLGLHPLRSQVVLVLLHADARPTLISGRPEGRT